MEWPDIRKILAPWLLLPLTWLDSRIAWDRLPQRVVMKFGQSGQPISWATVGTAATGVFIFLPLNAILSIYQVR